MTTISSPNMKDELYQADDSEIEEGGFTIEDAPDDLRRRLRRFR